MRRNSRKFWICPRCGAHLDFGERCDCDQRRGWQKEEEDNKRDEKKTK